MKKILLFCLLGLFPIVSYSQTNRLEKAKNVIRREFRNTINDYNSYEPISYGKVDSLYTSPEEDETIQRWYETTVRYRSEAGLDKLPLSYDVSETIEKMEQEPHLYKDGAILAWKAYNAQRELFLTMLNLFKPEFIGWKIAHKYRAKNPYNATILYNQEFHFNKELTKVTEILPVEE